MDEFIDVINEKEEITATKKKSFVHKNHLLHRISCVFVFKGNEFYIQKRSMLKRLFPGRYTFSASGHVKSGETTLQGIKRELQEELGIKASGFGYVGKLRIRHPEENIIAYIYKAKSNQKIKLRKTEVRSAVLVSNVEINRLVKTEKNTFSPVFIKSYIKFKNKIWA
ncbi:MAG: NUDIX domain-containing protein [Candidatus Nanoarchaeia archaeon]|nr:NUDIX domain-containing protein [Candidatus Nanoarchaeia archaeon]